MARGFNKGFFAEGLGKRYGSHYGAINLPANTPVQVLVPDDDQAIEITGDFAKFSEAFLSSLAPGRSGKLEWI